MTFWTFQHTAPTTASAEEVWALWSDVSTWPRWNADVAAVTSDGPFTAGTTVTMHSADGGDPVTLQLRDVIPLEQFVDEAAFGGLTIRTTHRFDAHPAGGADVTYRMEIEGPADLAAQVGPGITADFPETVASLITLAERG